MSFADRLFGGIKDLLVMRDEVARLTATTEKLGTASVAHEIRLVRIETIIEMSGRAAQQRLPNK